MEVALRPIQEVIPYARNARKIPPSAVDKVAASIREFGWRQPIVVDEQNIIVAGHTRLLAAQKLGLPEVPVHVAIGLTDAQIKAYRLMDNRSHQEATWDDGLLAIELAELRELAVDLSLTGFEIGEIDDLFRLEGPVNEGLADDDAAPEPPEQPVSRRGDLWRCGTHIVLCGDATEDADRERLIGDQRADLIFTDPPYNVGYQGYTEEKLTIQGDKMSAAEFACFLERAFQNYREGLKPGASIYVCHASSYQREFQNAIEAAGFEVRCQIIWAKNTFAWGHGRYKFQHEPIFYCHVAGQSDAWYGDKTQSTLWQEKKPAANRLHPTTKPVELIERALLNSSKSGDLVLDLFGGSGSTMIACEKRGRAARLAEIDPRYSDVIVQRWQGFTGREAVLEGDGRTFAEVAAARGVGRA
ncbi:MAG: DNA modification methylase [Acidobacteriota bacterium]